MIRKIAAILAAMTAVLFAVPGVASADIAPNGQIIAHSECSSTRAILLQWQNEYTKVYYNDWIYPCQYQGETGSLYPNNGHGTSEAQAFRTPDGWCTRFEINDSGNIYTVVNKYGTQVVWTTMHPGLGWFGVWKVDMRQYDC